MKQDEGAKKRGTHKIPLISEQLEEMRNVLKKVSTTDPLKGEAEEDKKKESV